MAVTSDPRFLLTRWSAGTDPFTRAQLDNDLATLDQYAARAESGLLSARPAAGIRDRFYTVRGDTAALNGTIYYDDGVAWSLLKTASSVPPGAVMGYAGTVAPTGYLFCAGQSLAKDAFPELFAAIGGQFGSTTTNFSLPDLRGRSIVGLDNMTGGAGDAGRLALANTRGLGFGLESEALLVANLPAHAHSIDHDHGAFTSGGQDTDHSHSGSTAGQTATHVHGYDIGDGPANTPAGGGLIRQQFTAGARVTGGASSDHGHNFGTGGASAGHGHSVDVPPFAGSSGAQGAGPAVSKLQPGMLLNYLIRALP
jgi:microcystin-dependent protein